MSNKIIWTGIALSTLGLGRFIPSVAVVGAVVLMVGVLLLWLDK